MSELEGFELGARLHLSTVSPSNGSWRELNDAEPPPRRAHSIAVGFIEEAEHAVLVEAAPAVRATQRSLLSTLLRSVSDVTEAMASGQQQRADGNSKGHAAPAQGGNAGTDKTRPIDIPSTTYYRDPRHIEERARLHYARAMLHRSREGL